MLNSLTTLKVGGTLRTELVTPPPTRVLQRMGKSSEVRCERREQAAAAAGACPKPNPHHPQVVLLPALFLYFLKTIIFANNGF